jgi:glycosyltransferase involved in cell wall biosynthesis
MSLSNPTAALVATVKNEGFYLTEWIAYHFLIGFEKIIVFNNDSTDETLELLTAIAKFEPRLMVIDWPSKPGTSPQEAAYNHAVGLTDAEWLCFLDSDEFIVPWQHQSILEFLATIPQDVAQLHVNWRGFGSGGVQSLDYELVIETFTSCAPAHWGNNHHYKSLLRRAEIDEVFIHHASLRNGRRCLTDFTEIPADNLGIAPKIVHNGIQINHYQCKTYPEFRRRRNNGGAYIGLNDLHKFRDGSKDRFLELDQNAERDGKILPFVALTRTAFSVFERFLPEHLRSAALRSNWVRDYVDVEADDAQPADPNLHGLITSHGTILCRPKSGPEIEQAGFYEVGADMLPIAVRLEHPADLPLSLAGRLAHRAALPENLPLEQAELVPGVVAGTAAIQLHGRYLRAEATGQMTLRGAPDSASECFLPLSATVLAYLRAIRSQAWLVQASKRLILPGQIRIGRDFCLDVGGYSADLRALPHQPSAENLTEITLDLTDGTRTSFIAADADWQNTIARSCLQATENNSQSFWQIANILQQAGFEGYGMDFRQANASYFLTDGRCIQLPAAPPAAIARDFDQPSLIAAGGAARNPTPGHDDKTFHDKLAASGCAGYMISFTGKRALYYSRTAETLIEQFS